MKGFKTSLGPPKARTDAMARCAAERSLCLTASAQPFCWSLACCSSSFAADARQRRFTEAKLGKASNALTETETLGKFLANDGKVTESSHFNHQQKTSPIDQRGVSYPLPPMHHPLSTVQVLRFYCLWDTRDTVPNGERRLYTLNYFLSDDTVEVLETKDPAGGRDPWVRQFLPILLRVGLEP